MSEHNSPSDVELASLTGSASKPLGSGSSRSSKRQIFLFLLSVFGIVAFLVIGANCIKIFDEPSAATDIETKPNIVSSSIDTSWAYTRWQPASTSTGDNCIPGFRLANTTSLHCGVGNLSPLSTSSNGDKYCGGLKLEQNYCVLPTEGGWAAPPSLQNEGSVNNSTGTLTRCKTMEDLVNGTFEGWPFDQEWVPKTCSAVPLSPFAWTKNAECQTTITMMGDSHIRNLFTATVNGLRGMESFAEAHASGAGKTAGVAYSYEWRLNKDGSATDRVDVHLNTRINEPTPFEDCPCDKVQQCLRIGFIWAPMFSEQLNHIHVVSKWKSNLVIVEPGNSYEQALAVSPKWMAKFDELQQEDENLHLAVLHFPWRNQPKGRVQALTAWTNGTYANRKSYLKQSSLHGGGIQGRNTFHFACGLGKVNVVNDKINAAEPCTDETDTAQIRALITIHFDALSKKTDKAL